MEKELHRLFEYSRDAVLCISQNHVTFANASAAELFGGDMSGKAAPAILPPHLLAEDFGRFISSAEIRGRHCSVSAIREDDTLILTFSEDTSDRKTASFVSDSLLSSMMAALCNIGLSIDLVSEQLEGRCDGKVKKYVSILYHNYYTLKRLTDNLRTSAALADGKINFLPRTTDLAKLCSDLISTVSIMMGNGAELVFSTDSGELIASIDPELIERLILNLLSNSFANTPESGRITVGLKARGSKAILSIDDTGSGIPPEILRNVFTRYEARLEDDLSSPSGGGLGLGIARGIVELHGGSLIIESRQGIGTSVRVMLPVESGVFSSPADPIVPSMEVILTELSGLLDSSHYTQEYMD